MDNKPNEYIIKGKNGEVSISANDKVAIKFAMLFEGIYGELGPADLAKKYNFSREYYYSLIHKFKSLGSKAFFSKKTGPKKKTVLTDQAEKQVIRHRFLEPGANAEVIGQKMRQNGFKISTRSVQRIISKVGVQKKNSIG